MGYIGDLARTVWRRWAVEGIPSSGAHEPQKEAIWPVFQAIDASLEASQAGLVTKGTRSELLSVTPPSNNMGGLVLNDANPSLNGYYSRVGSAWVRQRGLPDTFARVSLAGSGTAQTGGVEAGVNPADVAAFHASVATTNSGPLALSIGGETPRRVLNIAGNELAPGEWTGVVMFARDGSDYRLLIDAGAAASAAQSATDAHEQADRSETARAGAEAARDIAEGYASDAVSQGNVPLYSTHVGLSSLDIPVGMQSGYLWGFYENGDGGGKDIRRIDGALVTDPANPRWVRSADRFMPDGSTDAAFGGWWEIAEFLPNIRQFGARLNGSLLDDAEGDDDWAAVQAAVNFSRVVFVPAGVSNLSKEVTLPLGHIIEGCGPKIRLFGGTFANNGTVFKTFGAGEPKVWTDRNEGGDDPTRALFVAGGSGCQLKEMSLANIGETPWDFGLFVPGVKRTKIVNVDTFGKWGKGGVYLDATWGIANTYLTSIHPGIVPDDGPIETQISGGWLRGKFGLAIKGTTRNPGDYNASSWIWSPAGVSEFLASGVRIDCDRDYVPLVERAADGGGLDFDVRTISGSTGNRGWRVVFEGCAFRSHARYQAMIDRGHRIAFIGCDGETPGTTGLDGPAVLGVTSNTGDLAFFADNQQMRVRLNGAEIATQLYNIPRTSPFQVSYFGRDGRIRLPNMELQGAANPPFFYSGQVDGLFRWQRIRDGVLTDIMVASALSWRAGQNMVTDLGTPSFVFARGYLGEPHFFPGNNVPAPANGELVLQATSNTAVTIKLRGSDGVLRTADLLLS